MARAISDEELQLRKRARRRLIGAIVLVTLVVVALPMVLDSEPKPVSHDIDIRIPAPESAGAFTSKVVPLPESGTAAKPSAPATPAPAPESKPPQASQPAPANPAAKPQGAAPAPEAPKAAAAAKSEPAPAKPASAPAGRFVVQVVALSDANKAKQVQQQILATGVKSYTEVVKTARGDVTRVRAGPFATREAAEKAQQKLKGAGFDGKVVPAK